MAHKIVVFLGLATIVAIAGCASDVEKQARRDDAYDLSGDYSATKATGSATDMKISISDLSGRSNIRADVTRESGMEAAETSMLTRNGIADNSRIASALGNPIVLDSSHVYYLDGGSNISDDFGASDRFYICSQSYQYDANRKLYYCLSGTISKTDWMLRGSLTLTLETQTLVKGSDGKMQPQTVTDKADIPYAAKPGKSYFEQMFGLWSGPVNSRFLGPSNDLSGVQILLHPSPDKLGFYADPSKRTITVGGNQYIYNPAQVLNLSQVKDMSVPLIEIVYTRADRSDDRVVLFCQIYSLGSMTGSAVLIQGNTQTQFASFSMKRN